MIIAIRLLCGIWDLGGFQPDLGGGSFQAKSFRAASEIFFILVAKFRILSEKIMNFKRKFYNFTQKIIIFNKKFGYLSEES